MNKSLNLGVWIITAVLVGIVAVLFFMPGYEGEVPFDVTILPMMNAIFNFSSFCFLVAALVAIKKRNIARHRSFIVAAFVSTSFFLMSYVTYHYLTESTSYGGPGWLKVIYLFILLTHVLLAIVNVPLALLSITLGFTNNVERHRKIARWTMPIWMYVSITGVIVYLMISPYYGS